MLRLDQQRLLGALDELAAIGAIDGGGCARLALTDEDKAGRDLVVGWMKASGLDVHIDAIGNVIGVRAGREKLAPVMTGSHIDTVRTGGRYDGNYGVLAGLEVVRALNAPYEHVLLRRLRLRWGALSRLLGVRRTRHQLRPVSAAPAQAATRAQRILAAGR